MESYHISSSASRADGSQRSPVGNPYATIPAIGRLLDCIRERVSVGGTFSPGNRQLAKWLGNTSAGHIPALLAQLAADGWIRYDSRHGLITLLRTYGEVQR